MKLIKKSRNLQELKLGTREKRVQNFEDTLPTLELELKIQINAGQCM